MAMAGLGLGARVAATGEYYLSAAVRSWPASSLWTYAMVGGFLLVVALLALAVPSWGAARVDPVAALREDG